jgi:hypothetical protein
MDANVVSLLKMLFMAYCATPRFELPDPDKVEWK